MTHRALPVRRRLLVAAAALATVLGAGCAMPAHAVGSKVDVTIVDRDAGGALPIHPHQGRSYVAGRPGARYAIRVTNRTGERVLAVMSVDGVNILSGQSADWSQGGYVLAPWQSYEITGWRKSNHEVAGFEFTSLPDSYAARTGRPNDVGVIGVAVFEERVWRPQPQVLPSPPIAPRSEAARESRADSANGANGGTGSGALAERSMEKSARDSAPSASAMARAPAPAPTPQEMESRQRLGTGHGARETSHVTTTSFARASSRPAEIVAIQYDRFENLVRAGVIPQYGRVDPQPQPFPRSRRHAGYVPDPPSD